MRRPRVAYWNNIPSPYMVDRFNAVADRGHLDLQAWFSIRTEPDRSWAVEEGAWRFPFRYLPGIQAGPWRLEVPVGLLGRQRPDIVVSLYDGPSFIAGRMVAAMAGIPVSFWVETTFDSWVTRHPWKEWLKGLVFPTMSGIITVGEDGRGYAERYGAQPERIYYAPHSIDVAHFERGSDAARGNRQNLREQLGVSGCVFIYVGRLWAHGKGLLTLLDAFSSLQRSGGPETSLLFVGDGRDRVVLERRARELRLDRVEFAGFRSSQDLPAIYAASDVFVFPTTGDPYGLVLDEAMACALPLISSSSAGELNLRIDPGVNGLIVPPDDAGALAAAMRTLALDPSTRSGMGAASRSKVQGRTPEKWAIDFESAVMAMLHRPRAER